VDEGTENTDQSSIRSFPSSGGKIQQEREKLPCSGLIGSRMVISTAERAAKNTTYPPGGAFKEKKMDFPNRKKSLRGGPKERQLLRRKKNTSVEEKNQAKREFQRS